MKGMKLLLLLCVVVCQAFAFTSQIQKCAREVEPQKCRSRKTSFCNHPKNQLNCPKRCNLCHIQTKLTKTEFTKVACPVDSSTKSQGNVCWQANWNNGNGKSIIRFSPNYEYINNKKMIVGYYGTVPSDHLGSVFAMGDVEEGKKPVTFSVSSKMTNDSILEANHDSYNLPILANMYKTYSPTKVSLNGREPEPELTRDMRMESFAGYRINIQPVLDKKYLRSNQNNFTKASAEALAMLQIAKMAFQKPSLDYKIILNVMKPMKYMASLSANINSWVKTITPFPGPVFNYNKVPDKTIILFITKTPIGQIPAQFTIEYAFNGTVCGYKNNRVGIMEYFDSSMSASMVAIRIIGTLLQIGPDYWPVKGGDPKPRFGPNNENCTNVGGFMDILGAKMWTACSNFDLKNSIDRGNLGCLDGVQCPTDKNVLCEVVAEHVPNACDTLRDSCPRSCSPPCKTKDPKVPANASCPTIPQ